MPSREGFKTWMDYEILISAALIVVFLVLVAVVWGSRLLLGYLRSLSLSQTQFTLYLLGFCLGGILLMIWLAGRFNR